MNRETIKKPRSWFPRFHVSTLLVSVLFLLPCLLFSLPGRANGGGGTTGFWTTRYQHGWPFVFLERQTVQHSGIWVNKKFLPGVKPKDIDFDAEALRSMNAEHFDGVYWDVWFGLRFNVPEKCLWWSAADLQNASVSEFRFWSNPNRWPWIGGHDGEVLRIRWLGLLVDLLLLVTVFYVFARVIEFRMKKRGSHFSFSLAELLISICASAVVLACVTNEYRRAAQENIVVDRLLAAVAGVQGDVHGERGNSLPAWVSELLDYRSSLPLVSTHLYRPVAHAQIGLYELPDELPDERAGVEATAAVVDAIRNATFPIDLELYVYENSLPILEGIADLPNFKDLEITFVFDPAWNDETDSYRDDIELDFKLPLPQGEVVTFWLQSEIDQKKQIRILLPCQQLKRLNIHGLSREGAVFLNSVADQLPATFVAFEEDEDQVELSAPIRLMQETGW